MTARHLDHHKELLPAELRLAASRLVADVRFVLQEVRLKGLDAFCGGGGSHRLIEGCKSLDISWAVDVDRDCCQTYAVNFPDTEVSKRAVSMKTSVCDD